MREFRLLLPDDRGGIVGSVDEDGLLSFVVIAGPDSPLRGTEMFDLMMRSFGPAVRVIQGTWRKGSQGLPSTNIDEVNRLTASGMPLAQAVYHAWTCTRAARWGWTKVNLIGTPEGTPGNYTKIDVLIEKTGLS